MFLCRQYFSLSILMLGLGLLVPQALHAKDPFAHQFQPAITKSCIECHGDKKVKGKVDLLKFKTEKDYIKDADLIESMIIALEDEDMPPEDEPPLAPGVREMMIKQLEEMFIKALAEKTYAPIPIRRMNRFQYNNAVVDLLGLKRDVFSLPERLMRRRSNYFNPKSGKMPTTVQVSSRPLSKDVDGQRAEGFIGVAPFPQDLRAEFGYDTQADHLTLSPILMESFLALSRTIVASSDLNPRECNKWNDLFHDPTEEKPNLDLTRGLFEGESLLRNKKQGKGGKGARPDLRFQFANQPIKTVQAQKMTRFGKQWHDGHQLLWLNKMPDGQLDIKFHVKEASPSFVLGLTKARNYGRFELFLNDKTIGEFDLFSAKLKRPKDILINTPLVAGDHVLSIRSKGKHKKSKGFLFGLDYLKQDLSSFSNAKPKPNTPENRQLRLKAAKDRIPRLLRLAFRRPVKAEVLNRYVSYAEKKLNEGVPFTDVMKTIVGAVIASPEFLYLYYTSGKADSNGLEKIDDFELASRLSFFFWGSIPDDELLDLAEQGKLSDKQVLSKQIDRMLNDPRVARFNDIFPGQWLQLDRLISAVPDRKKFKKFYSSGWKESMIMMSEPLLIFEAVFLENRSVLELLDPTFEYVSPWGKQYKVQTFKRRPLKDKRYGGVITNRAVMTMTSGPMYSHPITRGAWINAVIFNDPPPPPPADVPPLPKADPEKLKTMTIRERFIEHREREDCAGCHEKIDPLGFALENYDPIGRWRDTYENGRDVDMAGKMFKKSFDSALEFKAVIVGEKHRFIKGFAAHLMAYGLGRKLNSADSPALDAIADQAINKDDSLRNIMKMVAMSEPFMHKNTQTSVAP